MEINVPEVLVYIVLLLPRAGSNTGSNNAMLDEGLSKHKYCVSPFCGVSKVVVSLWDLVIAFQRKILKNMVHVVQMSYWLVI